MDRAELRRLAEAAIAAQDNIVGPYNDETAVAWGKALQAYTKAANPCAIIELLDKLEAAEKVCEAAINEIVAFEGQKCTCFPEMLNGYCNECSNRKICKALKKWRGVK